MHTTPRYWPVSGRDYHACQDYLGSTALQMFAADTWAFYLQFEKRCLPDRESTTDMRVGIAVHALLSGQFDQECAVRPSCQRRSKADKELHAEFEANNPGKEWLTAEELKKAAMYAKAIEKDPIAAELLASPGRFEHSLRWNDEATGVGLKVRFDKLLDSGDILEFKTASSPGDRPVIDTWPSIMARRGYHRQFALYSHARNLYLGEEGDHYTLVVTKEFPCKVFVAKTGQRTLQQGFAEVRDLLAQIAKLRAMGDFAEDDSHWKHPWCQGINEVEMADWAFPKEEVA